MSSVTIYRFTIYDISRDEHVTSRRWGTRDGIAAVCGAVLEDTGAVVDASAVGGEVEGLTVRDFQPQARSRTEFQSSTA